jgi:dUTP pyrophosphatase
MKIKILKIKDVKTPTYANPGDAGLDLYSAENFVLKPGKRHAFETGIKMEVPDGYAGLIWDKSGLAKNSGIKTMAGVLDSGYRGEIKIVLVNLSNQDFKVEDSQKIAQILFQKIERPEIEIVDSLSKSERGEGGFGSTGMR